MTNAIPTAKEVAAWLRENDLPFDTWLDFGMITAASLDELDDGHQYIHKIADRNAPMLTLTIGYALGAMMAERAAKWSH